MDSSQTDSGARRQMIVIGIVSLFVAWCVRRYLSRPRNLPPGPSGVPFFGVLFTIMRSKVGPLELFTSWAEQYGEIYSFTVGPVTMVLVNSLSTIREAFQNPKLNDRPYSRMLEEITGYSDKGIALSNGEVWKEQRQFVHSVFRSLGVGKKSYEDTVAREVGQIVDAFEKKGGRPFDPNDLLCSAVSNIICSVALGTQYSYDDKEFVEILNLITANLEMSSAGGLIFYTPIPGISKFPGRFRKMRENIISIIGFIKRIVEAHRKDIDWDNPRDFIDIYLKRMKESEGKGTSFDDDNLVSGIIDLFIAGTETTSTSLKWAIMFMMTHQDVQSRVQKELDQVVGRDRFPRLDDRKDLPYTNAVVLECMRLGNVTPFSVPHVAAESTSVKGYHIPKGSVILANLSKVLHDESHWDAPNEFRPERFLGEDGELLKRDELIVFSTGRRVCLGEQLARMELFLFFTSLLHRYNFKKPDDAPPLCFDGIVGITRNTHPFQTCAVQRKS
ncbi:cytochrome P450 2J6-like [Diadema antillarum]|uniref:cytochrome P450 2J6-like n=1 Tax=Diadema antillarum TaxID=105358 RepID=UPI003A84DC5F